MVMADSIFKAIVESALKEVRQGAAMDEIEGEAAAEAGPDEVNQRHESLSRAATLGRACLPTSLILVTALLQGRANKLTEASSEGNLHSLMTHLPFVQVRLLSRKTVL